MCVCVALCGLMCKYYYNILCVWDRRWVDDDGSVRYCAYEPNVGVFDAGLPNAVRVNSYLRRVNGGATETVYTRGGGNNATDSRPYADVTQSARWLFPERVTVPTSDTGCASDPSATFPLINNIIILLCCHTTISNFLVPRSLSIGQQLMSVTSRFTVPLRIKH